MNTQRKLGGLAIAVVLATSSGGGTSEPQRDVLFEDTFDDDRNGWGVVDHPDFGTTTFEDGDYVWAFRGSIGHWLPAVLGELYDRDELDMLDVTVRAEATVLAGEGVIGVFCRENPDDDAEWQWYEFVARDGFAAIRRADLEGNLDVLAETDDVSLPLGEPLSIEATCVDDSEGYATLRMSLNDTEVLEATDDDPLVNGVSGLQAYTFPIHEQMDIRWHHFTVTRPAASSEDAPAMTPSAPPAGGSLIPSSTG
jgi:hypothetical protein